MICLSPVPVQADSVPAALQVGGCRYHVLPPEAGSVSVAHGQLIAVPLYDGELVLPAEPNAVLRYLGTVSGPALERIRTAAGSAASRRLALFRVTGRPSEGTTLQVRLRLPDLHEPCTSCRTVHFFIRVR